MSLTLERPEAPNQFLWATMPRSGLEHLIDPGQTEAVCHAETLGWLENPSSVGRACRSCLRSSRRAEPRIECTVCDTPTRVYRVLSVRYRQEGKNGITLAFLCGRCYSRVRTKEGVTFGTEQLDLPKGAVLLDTP